MKLRTRLFASYGLIIGLAMVVAPPALFATSYLIRRFERGARENIKALDVGNQVRVELGNELPALLAALSKPNGDRSEVMTTHLMSMRHAIEEARPYFATGEAGKALSDYESQYVDFENMLARWKTRTIADEELARELPGRFDDLRASLMRMRDIKTDALNQSILATGDFAHDVFVTLSTLGLLALAIGLWLVVRLGRSIVRPVEQLGILTERVGHYDFDIAYSNVSIDEFNELGRRFEAMGRALATFQASNMGRILVEQRRAQAVLDSIGDGLVIFSSDARIERINPVAERQLDVDPAVALGKRFEEIADERIGDLIRRVLADDAVALPEPPELIVDRNGESRTLALWLHRFVETASGDSGVVMVLRDVTTQREFERMRGDFLRRAAHELRTPMATIQMGVGLLAEKLPLAEGSREAELFHTVQHELHRMIALLTDMLDLSRLHVREHSLERHPCDIGQMLEAAQLRSAAAAAEAGVRIDLRPQNDMASVLLCRRELDRVLDNLVQNALEHTPHDGVVTLSSQRNDRYVEIAVADTGVGIASTKHALIFQPFVQLGRRRTGAGLSLAICQEIVKQHGGEIRLDSQPGQGARFTIRLPA